MGNVLRDDRQFPLRVESVSATGDRMADALLVERADYLARGMGDRVRQVEEQLALRGLGPDGEQLNGEVR